MGSGDEERKGSKARMFFIMSVLGPVLSLCIDHFCHIWTSWPFWDP